MADSAALKSRLARIATIADNVTQKSSTVQIYISNDEYAEDIVVSKDGKKEHIVPPPVVAQDTHGAAAQYPKELWNLTLVPGHVNTYTLQNVASGLYATVDENPSEGDTVVESTYRAWKISAGAQSTYGDFLITPVGTKKNTLFWSQDSAPNTGDGEPSVAIKLRRNVGTWNTSWFINAASPK